MILQIALLVGGLLLILFGANYLVDGSSSIARRFGLSEFVIGLTIVGIGPASTALYYATAKALRYERGHALKEFFHGLKASWKISMATPRCIALWCVASAWIFLSTSPITII